MYFYEIHSYIYTCVVFNLSIERPHQIQLFYPQVAIVDDCNSKHQNF